MRGQHSNLDHQRKSPICPQRQSGWRPRASLSYACWQVRVGSSLAATDQRGESARISERQARRSKFTGAYLGGALPRCRRHGCQAHLEPQGLSFTTCRLQAVTHNLVVVICRRPHCSYACAYSCRSSYSVGGISTLVLSRAPNASSIFIALSTVIPKYSFRSSRETWVSCTLSRLASSR